MKLHSVALGLTCALVPSACNRQPGPAPEKSAPAENPGPVFEPPALLLAQAQFEWQTDPTTGKRKPKPGPAKLVFLEPTTAGPWTRTILQDADSRVFHKAICRSDAAGELQLVTIAGTDAHLKTWKYEGGRWKGRSHWNPEFGGKWDRLRDFEFGDVDGDSTRELVIATHDQGVIAIAEETASGFTAKEVFRRANTFIHEIELGDLNGDGSIEIYATPSEPNTADQSQGGAVTMFEMTGGALRSETVAEFPSRHAKEILVTDIDEDGAHELYVSLEARSEKAGSKTRVLEPLEIRRYIPTKEGPWRGEVIATLVDGVQARVLLVGNVKGAGGRGMVVTTWKDGLWYLTPTSEGPWGAEQIDADSSGFEHAAALIDMDGDGKDEIYVAADDQDRVSRYRWKDGAFVRETIASLAKSDLTWAVELCADPSKSERAALGK